jgi:hypothetical protein
MDPGFRRDNAKRRFWTIYESIKDKDKDKKWPPIAITRAKSNNQSNKKKQT